jgi:SnoaL-like protein
VLARIRYVTKGAGTGLPFDTPMAAVFFMTDGKIRRGRFFWKIDDALEAAGLSESAMSRRNVEVARGVRTPVTLRSRNKGRTLDERFLVRFPALGSVMARAWSRLPPRVRRRWTARVIRQGTEAANRRDWKALFLNCDPEIEFHPAPSLVGGFLPPDQAGVHRGHDGYYLMWQGLLEAWEDLRLAPEEVIDFGEILLVRGRISGHARHTGIALDIPLFQVFFLRGGAAIRQRDFGELEQALEAAGLRE